MKQLLPLFLFLLPCLAWAQYPINGNQKITLGEQTTADGLIYRGVLADTGIITPSSDTSAYIILDTVNHRFYNYNRATNVWSVAGGGTAVTTFSGGTTGLTPNTATSGAVTLGGTLAVANGGTGASSFSPNNYLIRTNSSGVFDTAAIYEAGGNVGIGTASPTFKLDVNGTGRFRVINDRNLAIKYDTNITLSAESNAGAPENLRIYADNFNIHTGTSVAGLTQRLIINGSGNVGIGTATPTGTYGKLSVAGGISILNDNNAKLEIGRYSSGASNSYIKLGANSNSLRITNNTDLADIFTIENGGNVGMGTASPLSKLNIMGTVRINSASAPDANYYLQLENSASQKAKANAWDTYSDSRIKTNRKPIVNAIDKINLLNPIYYNQHDSYVEDDLLNIDYNNSYKSLGFIAQEVYEVIPESVNMGTTNELWAMDYTKLIPVLTKAIQEQQALIKALEQRIINLENK
jgi:uncharacterized protein YqkB